MDQLLSKMLKYLNKVTPTTVSENPRKVATPLNQQHVDKFQLKLDSFDNEIFNETPSTSDKTNYLLEHDSTNSNPFVLKRKLKGSLRARLLQFHEDVRPPYFGTWQKTSKSISGRRPFAMDNDLLDYDVDSEAEWDIGGPGESLKGDDSEEEDPVDDYEIDMKTFVPHGYVSGDEVDENSDNEQNENKTNNQTENLNFEDNSDSDIKIVADTRAVKCQSSPPAQKLKQKANQVIPIVIGIKYDTNPDDRLKMFQGVPCT